MTLEEHIEGLKGIKPFLQKQMISINYQGLGELDAKQIGETIDFAIKSIEELQVYKKALKLTCITISNFTYHHPENHIEEEYIRYLQKAREEL